MKWPGIVVVFFVVVELVKDTMTRGGDAFLISQCTSPDLATRFTHGRTRVRAHYVLHQARRKQCSLCPEMERDSLCFMLVT
jgi:hypothetical protein